MEQTKIPVTKLDLISEYAVKHRREKFTSLTHHLTKQYLLECLRLLKKKKAAGIDGRTLESYTQEEIMKEIRETAEKIQQRKYCPQPVRRIYIAKDNGKLRPLGIPTVIDKLVQMGVARILEAIYEPEFLNSSYGYRPKRNAHEALKEINHMIMGKKVNWIVDCDIQGFFDHINHKWMMRCLSEKITDPNFKRIIWKMLKAGIMQEGQFYPTKEGTPQGGIVSPVLANIYLHYILDLWFEKKVKRASRGYCQILRYADDFLIGVQYKEEAEKILGQLRKRLKIFGLTLSEEKTRIIEFGRFAQENVQRRIGKKPKTFDFLGFTHYCTKTRDGRFQVRLRTSKKRIKRATLGMKYYIKGSRSKPIRSLWETVAAKLRGHYEYYGVSGNFEGINRYYRKTKCLLFKWLNRRSQKRSWNWEKFDKYLKQYPLPTPKLTYAIYNTW